MKLLRTRFEEILAGSGGFDNTTDIDELLDAVSEDNSEKLHYIIKIWSDMTTISENFPELLKTLEEAFGKRKEELLK